MIVMGLREALTLAYVCYWITRGEKQTTKQQEEQQVLLQVAKR